MTVHYPCNLDDLIEAYKQHSRRARGLRDTTIDGYERLVRLFLRSSLGDDPIDTTRLGPADVLRFVDLMRDRFSARSMKSVRTALRSFFLFLRMKGLCDLRLAAAIPTVAHWRLSTLPRCLSDQQLEQLLVSFDASAPCAYRDRAIVSCMSSLGLRPGEVATLHLEDINWRNGTIRLRTRKTGRGAILPLPHEAGRAIVDYLQQERPSTDERVYSYNTSDAVPVRPYPAASSPPLSFEHCDAPESSLQSPVAMSSATPWRAAWCARGRA